MKKILMIAMVVALGLSLSTPLLAGHRDHWRGHSVRGYRGGYHGRGGYRSGCYVPYAGSRPRASLYFGFGAPVYYAPPPAYYYAPPVVVDPGYYRPVWVPGHYAYDRGARIFISGYWSR
jgi:hypothetical protein